MELFANIQSYLKALSFFVLLAMVQSCGGGSDASTPIDDSPTGGGNNPPPEVKPTKAEASKYLNRVTFGPTIAEIDNLSKKGYKSWVNEQIAKPITNHKEYYVGKDFGDDTWLLSKEAWWDASINGDDQLRQRVAFALSEIMVISVKGVGEGGLKGGKAFSHYYDLLLKNSFGNFRDLIEDVTLNPMMGRYLSMLKNRKPDPKRNIRPDENYAREIMQLFTIGLVELNLDGSIKKDSSGKPIPTYTQKEIEGLAHVFTGWSFGGANTNFWEWKNRDLEAPMKAFPKYHDTGEKTIIGGHVIPAGQTPEQDLKQALDKLFAHPNVGPFISKQLIQRLITSNPSPAYIERVAKVFNDNGKGVRGDMAAVVKAIVLDEEMLKASYDDTRKFGKFKEPIIKMTAIWRAFDGKATSGRYNFRWGFTEFGQGPLESPSVFNFFSPTYSPSEDFSGKGLVAPEFEIINENTIVKTTSHIHWRVLSKNTFRTTSPKPDDILINLARESELAKSSDKELVDHLNLLLLSNNMSSHMRGVLENFLKTIKSDKPNDKAMEAVALIVTSPEYNYQQ